MSQISKLLKDLADIPAYGTPGSNLLPSILVQHWSQIPLPEQLAVDFGLHEGATIGHLVRHFGPGFNAIASDWSKNDFVAALIYALRFTQTKRNEIHSLPILSRNWPALLKPDDVPWSVRTRSCLEKSGLLHRYEKLGWVTFGDLFEVPGMGVRSILEYAVILEQAMDIAENFYSKQSTAILNSPSTKSLTTSIKQSVNIKSNDVLKINLDTSVKQCDFPIRVINCLLAADILTLRDLITKTTFDLYRLPNFGKKSLMEVETFLAKNGLSLGQFREDLLRIKNPPSDNQKNISSEEMDNQEALLGNLEILKALAREPWAEQVFGSDPRFSDLLPFRKYSIHQQIESQLSAWSLNELTVEDKRLIHYLALEADDLTQRVKEISHLKLEDALEQLFVKLTGYTDVRKSVLIQRIGWTAEPMITLQKAGDLLDLTRERVRQLQERLTRRIYSLQLTEKIFLPQLEQAIDLIEKSLPLTTTQASKLLRDNGITRNLFSIENIQNVCEWLHHDCPFNIVTSGRFHGEKQVLVTTHSAINVRSLLQVARRLAGASGVANIYDVVERAVPDGENLEPNEAALVLRQASSTIEFLSDDWFWMTNIPTDRNRLRNTSRRMLSVVSPISLKEIRTGIRRHFSLRVSANKRYSDSGRTPLRVPPLDVLRLFFTKHPEFTIDEHDQVNTVSFLDYREELGETERIMADVLRSSPSGLLDRNSFRTQCVSRGMNPTTFDLYTSFSPIISHPDLNVWGLRGAEINPAAIAAIREVNAQRSTEKRVQDYGWSDEGNIWLKVRLPQNVQNCVIGCPSGISRFILKREFTAFDDDDQRCGTIKTSNSSLYGFGPFLRKTGADENDVLEIFFNIGKSEAYLSLSPEDSLAGQV